MLIPKPTQCDKLLDLLTARGGLGVEVWELIAPQPKGLGLSQYGARVYELRRKGWNIINKDNKFFLMTNGEKKIENEKLLTILREEYKHATPEGQEELKKKAEKMQMELWKCSSCDRDLDDAADAPSFCSEECRKKYWGDAKPEHKRKTLQEMREGLERMKLEASLKRHDPNYKL